MPPEPCAPTSPTHGGCGRQRVGPGGPPGLLCGRVGGGAGPAPPPHTLGRSDAGPGPRGSAEAGCRLATDRPPSARGPRLPGAGGDHPAGFQDHQGWPHAGLVPRGHMALDGRNLTAQAAQHPAMRDDRRVQAEGDGLRHPAPEADARDDHGMGPTGPRTNCWWSGPSGKGADGPSARRASWRGPALGGPGAHGLTDRHRPGAPNHARLPRQGPLRPRRYRPSRGRCDGTDPPRRRRAASPDGPAPRAAVAAAGDRPYGPGPPDRPAWPRATCVKTLAAP